MAFYFCPIDQQLQTLRRLILTAERSLRNKPIGSLTVDGKKPSYQYYHNKPGTKKRIYLGQKDLKTIKALAQKSYDKKFLKEASRIETELQALSMLHAERSASAFYQPLADIYASLDNARKDLVTPYVLPDPMFIQAWLDEVYEGLDFPSSRPEVLTDRGDLVRSKSEKIIADKLHALDIPYRYEYPIYLKDLNPIYVDFTLLDVKERTELHLEHFGMMHDPEYVTKTLRKIDIYQSEGLALGDKMLVTFEGEHYVFQSRSFEIMLRQRFCLDT